MPKRLKVTKQDENGRNTEFHDNFTGKDLTVKQLVREIKEGNYENYHIRIINGIETPASNPDPDHDNNLG